MSGTYKPKQAEGGGKTARTKGVKTMSIMLDRIDELEKFLEIYPPLETDSELLKHLKHAMQDELLYLKTLPH